MRLSDGWHGRKLGCGESAIVYLFLAAFLIMVVLVVVLSLIAFVRRILGI